MIPLAIDAAVGARPPLTIFGDDYDTDDGTCVRDYIHVDDLASAHLMALARLEQGETIGAINLGTGRGYSVREVIEAVQRVLGCPVPHAIGPRRAGDPPRLIARSCACDGEARLATASLGPRDDRRGRCPRAHAAPQAERRVTGARAACAILT